MVIFQSHHQKYRRAVELMKSVSMRLKVLSCVLAGVLCFGGLIGCSGSSGGEQSLADTGSAEQSDEAAKAAEEAKRAEEEALAQAEADRKAAEEAAAKAEADRKAAEEAAAQAEAEKKAAEEEAARVEAERKAAEEAAKAEAEEKARQEAAAAEAAAEAQAQAEAQAEDTNGYTVYITKTGEKYHSGGCRYLKKSKIAIDINDARAQGYEPCSVCNP